MKTYKSYADAKIANPGDAIYCAIISCDGREGVFGTLAEIEIITNNYHLCKPHEVKAETKPVFTQAMQEAGELPKVGSWFTLLYQEDESRFNDMNGHNFEVIGINDGVYTFRNSTHGFGALRLEAGDCKPIDTRTPKQKAVDDMLALPAVTRTMGDFCEALYDAGYRKC